jgi:nitrile hydratase beta subunit
VHDLGGMDGFGPVAPEKNEPVFHHDWERRVFALAMCSPMFQNLDAARHSIERMPPAEYLAGSYYEHWLDGLERGLIEGGILTREEINAALADRREPGERASGSRVNVQDAASAAERPRNARFRAGDSVVARNLNPPGHTRLPRYIRGHRGIVRRDWGVFTFPDTNAHGLGRKPQHCYCVEFSARELWGADRSTQERIRIDLWDDYLDPDRKSPAKRPTTAKRATSRSKPSATKAQRAVRRSGRAAQKVAKQARERR